VTNFFSPALAAEELGVYREEGLDAQNQTTWTVSLRRMTGGRTDLLSARVGPAGRVVGLDADAVLLDHARAHGRADVELVLGDTYRTALPGGSFDLVHVRFGPARPARPRRSSRKRYG
jgi:hypothetical protein